MFRAAVKAGRFDAAALRLGGDSIDHGGIHSCPRSKRRQRNCPEVCTALHTCRPYCHTNTGGTSPRHPVCVRGSYGGEIRTCRSSTPGRSCLPTCSAKPLSFGRVGPSGCEHGRRLDLDQGSGLNEGNHADHSHGWKMLAHHTTVGRSKVGQRPPVEVDVGNIPD